MINYDDKTHTYSYSGRRYLSATQLIDYFTNEFDSEERAEEHARNHGMDPDHWLEKWEGVREKALERGNRIHNLRESITNNRGMEIAVGQPRVVQNFERFRTNRQSLAALPDGLYTELIVWSHKWKIAGRIDRCIIESKPVVVGHTGTHNIFGAARYAHIEDFKTNRFIRMRSFPLNRECTLRRMMRYPIEHLEDCDKIHYDLQFSLYQFMLEEEHGYNPGERWIIHLPHIPWCAPPGATDPPPRRYACQYRRDDVISMLTHLKQTSVL